MRAFLALLLCLGLASAQPAPEVTRVRDVIYQKRDGFVLTMDVFQPA